MAPITRIIDANANRAREAIRVLEDLARFVLDHQPLCERLKSLRHDLRLALSRLPVDPVALLASRDTPGDVGTTVSTPSELSRSGAYDLAAANASRLCEAIRSIEEAAKTLPGAGSPAFESLRYRAYALEQELLPLLGAGRARQHRLCVLLTESLCRLPWMEVAKRAIEGGADAVQLREKHLDGGELLLRARALVALAGPRGVTVFVNDRPDVALLAGAHGVHLGQTDLPIGRVRELVGGRLLIGVSTGCAAEAAAAAAGGADLCGVGPMFPTTTKEKPRIAGVEYLREYLAAYGRVPHLAIGGITPENAGALREAGCRGIAVSSVVCGAEKPDAVCAALVRAIT